MTLHVGLKTPILERLPPAHAHMLDIVEAAESLGYTVQAVSSGSVTLSIEDVEITVSGYWA